MTRKQNPQMEKLGQGCAVILLVCTSLLIVGFTVWVLIALFG